LSIVFWSLGNSIVSVEYMLILFLIEKIEFKHNTQSSVDLIGIPEVDITVYMVPIN